MDHFNITIIGAGVVGLAIAEELSSKYRDVLVLEKNNDYGQETSSRNSEVIHAGIYYPAGTMKAKFCREGNRLLYAMCKARGIPFRNTGKIIVAGDPDEADGLREIRERAQQNEIGDLSYLSRRMLCRLEPQVRASDALFSPSTGIIDSHQLMRSFYIAAKENGTVIVLRSEVTAVHFDGRSYDVEINHGAYRFNTSVLINSAGLHADRIAAAVGIDVEKEGYRLKYCRGNY
ncbi:MAG: NAD(P)/FAD-dependent oxidoreductase, partial [Syntrophales bacterium]